MGNLIIGKSEPLDMRAFVEPTSVFFEMQPTGGTLEQWYYANTNDYDPDREDGDVLFLTPILILCGKETGRKYTPEKTVHWEFDGASLDAYTTDNGSAKFVVRPDGTLLVKKNIAPGSGTGHLHCTITYVDPLSGNGKVKEWDGTLITHQKADPTYAVAMQSSDHQTWNPLSGESPQKTFTASARLEDEDMSDSVKWFWYWLDGNTRRLIQTHPAYVSGQGTKTITVNAEYAISLKMYAMVAASSTATQPDADQPGRALCQLEWRLPKVKARAVSPNGQDRIKSEKTKQFDVSVIAGKTDLDTDILKERTACRWMKVKAGAADAHVAWGHSIVKDVSDITYANEYGMRPDLYLLGPLEPINGVIAGQEADSTPAGQLVGQSCTGVIAGEASGDTLAGQPCYGRKLVEDS